MFIIFKIPKCLHLLALYLYPKLLFRRMRTPKFTYQMEKYTYLALTNWIVLKELKILDLWLIVGLLLKLEEFLFVDRCEISVFSYHFSEILDTFQSICSLFYHHVNVKHLFWQLKARFLSHRHFYGLQNCRQILSALFQKISVLNLLNLDFHRLNFIIAICTEVAFYHN